MEHKSVKQSRIRKYFKKQYKLSRKRHRFSEPSNRNRKLFAESDSDFTSLSADESSESIASPVRKKRKTSHDGSDKKSTKSTKSTETKSKTRNSTDSNGTSSNCSDCWITLKPLPSQSYERPCHPIVINNNEFVKRTTDDSFQKFNVVQNKWFSHSIEGPAFPTLSKIFDFEKASNTLLYVDVSSLLSQNIDTGFQTTLCDLDECPHPMSHALLIDGDVHLLGKLQDIFVLPNIAHYKLNTQSKISMEAVVFWESNGCEYVVHSEARNSIIAVMSNPRQKFGEYSLFTKEWKTWEIQYPTPEYSWIHKAAMVCSSDGRYLIMLGVTRFADETVRNTDVHNESDRIYVFDLDDHKSSPRVSEIRCPMKGRGCYHSHALLMGDERREEIITLGFVRRFFKNMNMKDLQFPPR